MYIFSSFTANTLLAHKFKCLASFTKCTCSSLVCLFFCTVLQFFALVFCFGDQVLSPGSSLVTDFLGVVPLWRVAKRKFFQPWFLPAWHFSYRPCNLCVSFLRPHFVPVAPHYYTSLFHLRNFAFHLVLHDDGALCQVTDNVFNKFFCFN